MVRTRPQRKPDMKTGHKNRGKRINPSPFTGEGGPQGRVRVLCSPFKGEGGPVPMPSGGRACPGEASAKPGDSGPDKSGGLSLEGRARPAVRPLGGASPPWRGRCRAREARRHRPIRPLRGSAMPRSFRQAPVIDGGRHAASPRRGRNLAEPPHCRARTLGQGTALLFEGPTCRGLLAHVPAFPGQGLLAHAAIAVAGTPW